ncbi:MAG: hypothetical protein AAGJ97_10610, partial [Planctomycetota bacterium]
CLFRLASFRINESNQPTHFTSIDIGTPPSPGVTYTNPASGVVAMNGRGSIDKKGDEIHFAHERLSGDFSLTTEVVSLLRTNASGRSGVMLRENTKPTSAFHFISLTSDGVVDVTSREAGDLRSKVATGAIDWADAPRWLRIKREGAEVTSFHSRDGRNWSQAGSLKLNPERPVLVGLAIDSSERGRTTGALYHNTRFECDSRRAR